MCLCCHESDMVNYQREELDLQSITKHPGFEGNCINEYVLETSFWEYLADNGHVGDDEPVHEKVCKIHLVFIIIIFFFSYLYLLFLTNIISRCVHI